MRSWSALRSRHLHLCALHLRTLVLIVAALAMDFRLPTCDAPAPMAAPQSIQSKAQWWSMLDAARRRTNEMLAFDPDRVMLKVILAQLDFMEACTREGRSPTDEEADRITVGAIAVKNLDQEDAEYAGWLSELAYAFRKTWSSLP